MLSALIVAEHNNWHRFKNLEECLINDYHVDYIESLNPDPEEISKIEFSYEIIFYLKFPSSVEVPAISRLSRTKVFIFHAHKNGYIPLTVNESLIPVSGKLALNAVSMRGKLEYYLGVDKIVVLNPHHIEPSGYEVILNGNRDTKAMLGDLAFRVGKNVVFGIRDDNVAVFSADIFSNEAFEDSDNCRFIRNLVNSMLGSAELY
jgi:hypothetical protein